MSNKSSQLRILFAALVIAAILGLPMAAGAQIANGISSPAEGATVRGTVDVKGYADNPSFSKWQLDLLPGGDPNAAVFLALGVAPRDFVYALDTTKWPDGNHALRARVVRADGNYDEYLRKIVIANRAAAATGGAAAAAPPKATPATAPVTKTVAAATAAAAANGISTPPDGATVSGDVNVTGNASDVTFQKWQLDLVQGKNANVVIFLSVGNTSGTLTYTLNTKVYPDGPYGLRLRNVRRDGNYAEYTNAITIANASGIAAAAGVAPPTQVLLYQPAADSSMARVQATCAASTALPDRAAYRCSTVAGATLDPCMVSQGNTLVCPNARMVVTATNTLPSVPREGMPAPFALNLAQKYPSCDVNTNPGKTLDGQPVTFACAAPGAWLLGAPNTSEYAWVVQYVTTDSQGTKVTFGPVSVAVTRALVY
jgi:hypothetical protein